MTTRARIFYLLKNRIKSDNKHPTFIRLFKIRFHNPSFDLLAWPGSSLPGVYPQPPSLTDFSLRDLCTSCFRGLFVLIFPPVAISHSPSWAHISLLFSICRLFAVLLRDSPVLLNSFQPIISRTSRQNLRPQLFEAQNQNEETRQWKEYLAGWVSISFWVSSTV